MTKKELLSIASGLGIDLVGVAPIERFAGVLPQSHPSSIFPEARTAVEVACEWLRERLRPDRPIALQDSDGLASRGPRRRGGSQGCEP